MKKNDKILLFVIILIYIALPVLICRFHILFDIKFYLLTVIGILMFILLKIFKVSNEYLGITKKNLMKSVKRNLPVIMMCIIFIAVVELLPYNRFTPNETIEFYAFYIFISCPIQEFLYRGVFGYFEKIKEHKWIWLIASSICYAFVHIIYRDYITCIITFIIGIIWYQLYRKDYNLFGVVLSHIILGILTISLGIIN